jgi:putative spermidine/putrescine transport system ATP-binding protein
MTPIVRLHQVSKTYGTYRAIDAIDLDIQSGEFITFLGPSGSGKTTTLMMLAGFEAPSAGMIEMEGKRIERLPAHKRNIGVVFQNYALFPHMTVRENLAFPLKVRGLSRSEREALVETALAQVHLEKMGDRKPGQLSGGQQQRVALARAIIFQPRLIVLDEPLGALDKSLREHLQAELKALHRDLGTTMVFVTHDQSEALMLSDRIAVFNRGKIEQLGTPGELYRVPATPFVASFIGENNLLPGQIEARNGSEILVRFPGGGTLRAPAQDWCAPGQAVTFNLRPESLRPQPGQEPAGHQCMTGKVVDHVYLGDQNRVAVEVPGIGRLVLKLNAAEVLTLGADLRLEAPVLAARVLAASHHKK